MVLKMVQITLIVLLSSLFVGINSATLECYQCQGRYCLVLKDFSSRIQQCNEGSKCLTELDSMGQIVRRCTRSPEEICINKDTCNICEGNLCNFEIFPSDRLRCLQCDSNDYVKCNSASIQFLKPCEIYKKDDECFTYANYLDNLYRGCVSDNNRACTEHNCVKCHGDNCNNGGIDVPNTIKCVKCDASKGDVCEEGKLTSEPVICGGTHRLNERESCFFQNTTQATIKRGCFFELSSTEQNACTNSRTCHTCEKEGCNKVDNFFEYKEFKCFVCKTDASNTKACEIYPEGPAMRSQICKVPPSSFNEGAGCFVHRSKEGVITRDCKTSISNHSIDLADCSKDYKVKNKKCIYCNDDSCNTQDAPGSAVSIKTFKNLMVLPVLMFVKYLL
ncbi:hypothetical protein ACFFRR_003177 [Megaselia abdita]